MKTYLSIDMDYWNGCTPAYTFKSLFNLLERLQNKGIPMMACMNHQQMLHHVNNSNARKLINLDTHSDLAQPAIDRLNCGTWVSYIKWRHQGEYIWCHRDSISAGDCSRWGSKYGRIFPNNGMINKISSDWQKIQRIKMHLPNYKYLTNHTVAAGLVLSPEYVEDELECVFYDAIKKFNLNYLKGRRDEFYSKFAIPPGLSKAWRNMTLDCMTS